MTTTLTVPIRVRYCECDPMNVAHHSAYAVWFEIARTELLRAQGSVYAEMEKAGVLFVVAKLSTRFRKPAVYDDELRVEVTVRQSAGVKIEHTYRVLRRRDSGAVSGGAGSATGAAAGDDILAIGETTLACVDRDGKLRPVPDALR
ncbi:MAG: thioesterase family protein [Planctomycetota bacterium]